MKWTLIQKGATPTKGTYKDWKELLAKEAAFQCVYCCIPEHKFGGTRNFHVEHFRPKSSFPLLENDYANLFYACGICNTFKGDDWPAEPKANDYSFAAYHDPSKLNYSNLLKVDENGKVESTKFAGRYLIERTFLNRPQMITVRRMASYVRLLREAKELVDALYKSGGLTDEQKDAAYSFVSRFATFFDKVTHSRPYQPADIRRTR